MGGPSGQFLGPPTGSVEDFLGVWNFSWAGPTGSKCPCRGTITIEEDPNGRGLIGRWKLNGLATVLRGPVSFNENVWAGSFEQVDDSQDFPLRGYFKMQATDTNTLTGSYRTTGTAASFHWDGTRD